MKKNSGGQTPLEYAQAKQRQLRVWSLGFKVKQRQLRVWSFEFRPLGGFWGLGFRVYCA